MVVLSVGQCGTDDSRIARLVREAGATLERAEDAPEARAKLGQKKYSLVLVNRVFDADGDSGIEFIRELAGAAGAATRLMLVSDYDEAQLQAIAAGAQQGFGKSQLTAPGTLQKVRTALQE